MTKKNVRKVKTMRGTIVAAGRIQDFYTQKGKRQQSAMLHIQDDSCNASTEELAVKVSGDLCNYVGCVGANVVVDYVVRVFECVKNGIQTLGNDVYATSIRMAKE